MMFAFLLAVSTPAASATCDAKPFTLNKPAPVKVAAREPVKVEAPKPKPKPVEKPRILAADCDKPAKK